MKLHGRRVQRTKVVLVANPQQKYTGVVPKQTTGKKHNLKHHVNPFLDMTADQVAAYHTALVPGTMWLSSASMKADWDAKEGDECNVMLTHEGDANKICGPGHMMLYIGPREVERMAKDRKSGRTVTTKDIIHTFLLRDRIVAPWTLSLVQPSE